MGTLGISDLRRVIFDALAWRLSKRELHALMQREDVREVCNATEEYVGRGFYARIHAVQVQSEIVALGELVQKLNPKVVAEIGTYKGGTLFIWCRTNPRVELFVSIDLPGGRYGGGYDKRRARLYREFIADRPWSQMVLLQANSHERATLEALRTQLKGRPIDFLYIDGDHTYQGAKQDYEMYAPLVRKGGMVAFHDVTTRSQDCGVWELWSELKRTNRVAEFIGVSSNKGIGVVMLD